MTDILQTHSWIAQTIGKRLWFVVLLCLIQGVLAANGVAYALLMRNTVDAAVAGVSVEFWAALACFAGIILLQVLLRAVNRYASERVKVSVENRLREWAFCAVLRQDAKTSGVYHSGDVMTRLTSDVQAVTTGVASFIPTVVSMGVRVVGVFAAMLALVPKLALVFLGLGCVMGLASIGLRGVMKRLHKRVQEAESTTRSFLQECLDSLTVIRAFGVEGKVQRTNWRNMNAQKRARLTRANVSNAGNVGLSLTIQGGYVLGFAWCGLGILEGTVTYGTLMAVIQLISQIQSPFASMGGVFSQYSAMLASAERLIELRTDNADAIRSRDASKGAETSWVYDRMRSICFDNVSFSYDQSRVLDSFSLEVSKNSFVAIAGSSGIGKSTLMKLLLGIYEPDEGAVFLKLSDGEALPVPDAPAGMFAYVPQGNHLMSGTIREVVGFAEQGDHVDEVHLRKACEAACAIEFIEELPEGFDTVLGEHGSGLSEGQMQRLAVARALYSQAPVLLLDEATSALDDETERAMLARIRQLANRTVIVVTHRSEALCICDMIVEMGHQS